MSDEADILDDMIPTGAIEDGPPPMLLAIGQRNENQIVQAIKNRMPGVPVPVVFIECENADDDPSDAVLQCWATDRAGKIVLDQAGNRVLMPELQKLFGRVPTARQVIDLHKEFLLLIHEQFAPHLEIARSLGKAATLDDYGKACEAAGITPLEGLQL